MEFEFVDEGMIWEMVPEIYSSEEAEKVIKEQRTMIVFRKLIKEIPIKSIDFGNIFFALWYHDEYINNKMPTNEEIEKIIKRIINKVKK